MNNNSPLEVLIKSLSGFAAEEYLATEEYRLLRAERQRIDIDCETMLTREGQGFVKECFDTLALIHKRETEYVTSKTAFYIISLAKEIFR